MKRTSSQLGESKQAAAFRKLEDDFVLDARPFIRSNGILIFRGMSKDTGKTCAVKMYDGQHVDDHKLRRIMDEARIGQLIPRHPGVVRTFGFYPSSEHYALVMDLMDGGTLLDELMHRGPMLESRGRSIVKQLLMSVQHIHTSRVMHRDIKPENIYLIQSPASPTDKNGEKVKDGLAVGDFSLSTTTIPSSDYVGSPQYAAPELAMIGLHRSNPHVSRPLYNEKCDLWSVGIVTFVILTGLLPFDGDSPEEIFTAVLTNVIPFEKCPHMSPTAKSFVVALTKSNPSARPSARDALAHPWIRGE